MDEEKDEEDDDEDEDEDKDEKPNGQKPKNRDWLVTGDRFYSLIVVVIERGHY